MKIEQHPTVAIVITRDSKYLLLKRAIRPKGKWCIPGGHVESGELLEEVALREGKEEVGEIELGEKITEWTHDVKIGHRHEATFFFAKLIGNILLNEESSDYKWLTLKEMKQLETTDWTRFIFNYLIENQLV